MKNFYIFIFCVLLCVSFISGCSGGGAKIEGGSSSSSSGGLPTPTQNRNPIINQLAPNPSDQATVGQVVTFTLSCQDPDGDPMTYSWSSEGGTLSTNVGNVTSWRLATVPPSEVIYAVHVVVTDGRGGSAQGSVNLRARPDGGIVISQSLPHIDSLSPSSGPVGTSVVINGSNFTGAYSVSFGGIAANVSSVSSTLINTVVPTGAATGSVAVTTSAGTSNTVTFTVTTPTPAPTTTPTPEPTQPPVPFFEQIPVRGITPFWGSISNIPTNWELCDGSPVYTAGSPIYGVTKPDLVNKFARGAIGDVAWSNITGGAEAHSHTGNHTHTITADGSHSHNVNSHAHTVYGHYHVQRTIADGVIPGGNRVTEQSGIAGHSETESNGNQESGGSSPGTSSEGVHNHSGQTVALSLPTNSAIVLPPYIGLLYIIRVK